MKASKAHAVIRTVRVGDDHLDRFNPRLDDDGRIAYSPEDGVPSEAVAVSCVTQRVATLDKAADLAETAGSLAQPELSDWKKGCEVWVTDSRVLFRQVETREPGLAVVGQIRFPWIASVEFRPKQSFVYESILNLSLWESFEDSSRGSWLHTIEFKFPKTYHPGLVAQRVVRRIAAHHMAHGAPAEAAAALGALSNAPLLPDPPKGELSMYALPAFVNVPGGAAYIGDEIPEAEWILASAATTAP